MLVSCFKSLFPLWVVSQLFTKSAPLESVRLEERIEIFPMTETTEEEVTVETVGEMAWPWRRFIRDLADQEDALPEMSLLDDVAPVLPTAAIGRGTICNSRNPQAGELLPGGRLVLNFHDDPGWDHSRLFLWPIDATTWIVLTPDGDKFAERFADFSRMRVLSLGVGEMPEVGSVEFHRGWTLNVLSELLREGRNLALCARNSTGSTRR